MCKKVTTIGTGANKIELCHLILSTLFNLRAKTEPCCWTEIPKRFFSIPVMDHWGHLRKLQSLNLLLTYNLKRFHHCPLHPQRTSHLCLCSQHTTTGKLSSLHFNLMDCHEGLPRVHGGSSLRVTLKKMWRGCFTFILSGLFQQNLLETHSFSLISEQLNVSVSCQMSTSVAFCEVASASFTGRGAAVTTLCIIFNTNSEVHRVTLSSGGSVRAFHFCFFITARLVTNWDIKIIYNLNIMLPEPMVYTHYWRRSPQQYKMLLNCLPCGWRRVKTTME